MLCASHPPCLDHSNCTWWRVQVIIHGTVLCSTRRENWRRSLAPRLQPVYCMHVERIQLTVTQCKLYCSLRMSGDCCLMGYRVRHPTRSSHGQSLIWCPVSNTSARLSLMLMFPQCSEKFPLHEMHVSQPSIHRYWKFCCCDCSRYCYCCPSLVTLHLFISIISKHETPVKRSE
jgi:hypothetical protein